MRILSFKNGFKEKLLDGTKYSTMRKHKKPHKQGDFVQIYCPSPRSGKGEKLFNAEIQLVQNVLFNAWESSVSISDNLNDEEKEFLAKSEGFDNFEQMCKWFMKEYPKDNWMNLTRYVFYKKDD